LLGLLVAGCAVNPVSGRPQVVLVSSDKEQELGREQEEVVEQEIGLVDHGSEAWVKAIGKRLAAQSPRQDVSYRFAVVDMPEPNAFALPGGPVYVSRGLLSFVNSEDELAGVIAHEIGHVAARHAVGRVSLAAPFVLLAAIPGAIVGTVSQTLGAVVAAPGAIAGGLAVSSYSRGQELDADKIGMEMVAKAGWDPVALAAILHAIERSVELERGKPRKQHLFDSHPATPARIAQVEKVAPGLTRAPAKPIAGSRSAVFGKLDGLLVGDDPAAGVFEGATFLHPSLGFAMQFPDGWKTQNRPTAVLAADPEGKGEIFSLLQLVTESADPMDGVRKDELHDDLMKQLREERIHGLPARRLVTQVKGHAFDMTWIAHRKHVYRIVSVCPQDLLPARKAQLATAGTSFRPLTDADVARIREARLRVRQAQGESATALAKRLASPWNGDELAVANGLESGATTLAAGRPVKVPLREAYRAR
jgi:predicted Zn-dependent protease